MTWHWLDLVTEQAAAAASAPAVGVAGRAAGPLAIWTTRARPTHGARRPARRAPPEPMTAPTNVLRSADVLRPVPPGRSFTAVFRIDVAAA